MTIIKHYGWQVSPYSAKTRSFLNYTGIVFEDIAPHIKTLLWDIKPAVGDIVMPTVRLSDGRFLRDSSNIIDFFAQYSQAPSIIPKGSKQHIASMVLEVYADEWLPLMALHYRWNRPENARFAIAEFGKSATPWLPRPLQKLVGQQLAKKMKSYLLVLGITSQSSYGIEKITIQLLDDMNEVFASQAYLFGQRPSLGDFALYGPLYAHLLRDPATASLFDTRPNLYAWLLRMDKPKSMGDFLADDVVHPAVERILQRAFAEQWVYLQQLTTMIDAYVEKNPEAHRVPRALGTLDIQVGGIHVTRKALTFAQWKMQRACAAYTAITDKTAVDYWLDHLGGAILRQSPKHPFIFVGMKLYLASHKH